MNSQPNQFTSSSPAAVVVLIYHIAHLHLEDDEDEDQIATRDNGGNGKGRRKKKMATRKTRSGNRSLLSPSWWTEWLDAGGDKSDQIAGDSDGMGGSSDAGSGKKSLRWLFEQWMAEFGKSYLNEAEKARRFENFKREVGKAERLNRRYGKGSCVLNELAD